MKRIHTIIAALAALAALTVCVSAETIETTDSAIGATVETEVTDFMVVEPPVSEDAIDGVVIAAPESEITGTTEAVTSEPAGDIDAEDKGSPDTGVASVAGIVGIAVAAGGVLLLASKRK